MPMQLNDITLHNFGPYYGEQSIAFGTKRPIVIVHGDNMRGKTSLLRAIRWALYGVVRDRFGKRMPLLNLINWDAADEADYTMSVTMTFHLDDAPYELVRAVQPKKSETAPTKDSHLEEKLFLRKANTHLNPDQAQTEVNRIMPEQTSRFFLFDGELLSEYEVLVADEQTQAALIKESIEHILGVPALRNAVSDLRLNLKDAAKRQRRLAREDEAAGVFASQAAELEAEIEALEEDAEDLQRQRDDLLQRQVDLDERLRVTAGMEADAQRLGQLKEHIHKYKQEEAELLDEKRDLLSMAWKDLLQPSIRTRLDELELEAASHLDKVREKELVRLQIDHLKHLVEDKKCPVCGQDSGQIDSRDIGERIKALERRLESLAYDEEKLIDTSSSIRVLRQIEPAGVIDAIFYTEAKLLRTRLSIVDYESKRDDLDGKLQNHDYSEVIRNRREYITTTKEIGIIEGAMSEKQLAINEKQVQASQVRGKISEVSGPEMDRLNREVRTYEELINLFERGVERLRDDLRTSVEADASEIFLQLTADKSYTGLQINENYGLDIMDSEGSEVPVRSAGAEQVVALSLIGALNRNAVRRGPVIMDTPFGRLDPSHRENILRFIPTLANQVALLVHGGELDRHRDLDHIRSRIEREYEIRFVSSRRSEIIRVKEVA